MTHGLWLCPADLRPCISLRKNCLTQTLAKISIHHLDDNSSLDLIADTIREIVKIWNFNSASKPDIELAIDGQLCNWVRDSENNKRLYYILKLWE